MEFPIYVLLLFNPSFSLMAYDKTRADPGGGGRGIRRESCDSKKKEKFIKSKIKRHSQK
jgi:hypothetical protein